MPDIISAGTDMLAQPAAGASGLQSLKDFTDINKLVGPDKLPAVGADLASMGEKMKDLGAKFKDSDAAKNLFNSVSKPDVPNYDGAFSSLGDMMGGFKDDFAGMTGSGSGPLGLPSMQDFMGPVSGGAEVSALLKGVNASSIAGIQSMVTKSQNLFTTAGIDVTATPPMNLGTLMQAATSLHKIGAEANGAGSADILKSMIPTGSSFGDSIKAAMAEGQNMKAMAAAGISPPSYNPFDGLPSAPDNIGSEAAAKLLSGG